jgi:hypothetical protein
MNPLKLYEYLAAGRPVVSTPVAGVELFSDCVVTAAGAKEFAAGVEVALSGSAKPEECKERMLSHSWASRVDVVLRELREVMARTAAAESPTLPHPMPVSR